MAQGVIVCQACGKVATATGSESKVYLCPVCEPWDAHDELVEKAASYIRKRINQAKS